MLFKQVVKYVCLKKYYTGIVYLKGGYSWEMVLNLLILIAAAAAPLETVCKCIMKSIYN